MKNIGVNTSSKEVKLHDGDKTLPSSLPINSTMPRQSTTNMSLFLSCDSATASRCNHIHVLLLADGYYSALYKGCFVRASTSTGYVEHVVSSLTIPAFDPFLVSVRLHFASPHIDTRLLIPSLICILSIHYHLLLLSMMGIT